MKYLLSAFITFFMLSFAAAQTYNLQARVDGFKGNRAYLIQLKGDQQSVIDSASSLEGVFLFQFSASTKPGVYRIILGDEGNSNFFDEDPQFFDFIFNNEPIVLNTSFSNLIDAMNVLQSKENAIYYRYLKANEIYQSKMSRITPLFTLYKPENPFYAAVNKEFAEIQTEFIRFSLALIKELPESLASSVIQGSLFPVIEQPGTENEMKTFLRDHYFDLITFKDQRLLNSPVITRVFMEYLGLFRDPLLNQSQQEDRFIIAINQIMEAASDDPKIYDFTLNFLVDGFQRFQMEKVLVHIAENFIEGGCETDSKKLLQKRLEGYEKMAPGKKAPDILNLDQNGNQIRLYDIDRDYTLVLFWASWCPHCAVFLKQLSIWYPNKPIDLDVFAVSIDSSRFAWEERIMMDNYPWINIFSGAGWDGKAPREYNVYATPTMFLLDREHKIIAKPTTFREFRKEIEEIEARKN